jgi:hypothetical protein
MDHPYNNADNQNCRDKSLGKFSHGFLAPYSCAIEIVPEEGTPVLMEIVDGYCLLTWYLFVPKKLVTNAPLKYVVEPTAILVAPL